MDMSGRPMPKPVLLASCQKQPGGELHADDDAAIAPQPSVPK